MGELKNRRPFSTTLENELYRKFDKLVKDSRINKSKLTDEAIELLLEKHNFKDDEKSEEK